jgi:hypothetical protein
MPKPRIRIHLLAFALWLLPLTACGSKPSAGQPTMEITATREQAVAAETPSAEGILPTPIPQGEGVDIEVPDPDPGKANVVGRIFWNESPASNLGMLLCEDMNILTGCEGVQFDSRTNDDGVYIFASIDPGEYSLVVESLDGEHWLYVTAGLGLSAKKYSVAADNTLRIPDQSIYNFDLVTISPEEDESVSEARPTLSWEPYPDAAYFLVYLTQENGSAIFMDEKTDALSIVPPKDLLSCEYTWQVEAYNNLGTKISEHDGYLHFKVTDQPLSCYLDVISPANGAAVSGSELILEWKAHDLAAYYRVHIWDSEYNDLLEGTRVDDTAVTVPLTLAPGEYTWFVTAYDEDDKQFAQSDVIDFTVTE